MTRISSLFAFLVFALLSLPFALAYQKQPPQAVVPQTPRQALIEMIRGGGEAVLKHLTVEMQQVIPGGKTAAQHRTTVLTSKSRSAEGAGARSTQDRLPESRTEITHSSA